MSLPAKILFLLQNQKALFSLPIGVFSCFELIFSS